MSRKIIDYYQKEAIEDARLSTVARFNSSGRRRSSGAS